MHDFHFAYTYCAICIINCTNPCTNNVPPHTLSLTVPLFARHAVKCPERMLPCTNWARLRDSHIMTMRTRCSGRLRRQRIRQQLKPCAHTAVAGGVASPTSDVRTPLPETGILRTHTWLGLSPKNTKLIWRKCDIFISYTRSGSSACVCGAVQRPTFAHFNHRFNARECLWESLSGSLHTRIFDWRGFRRKRT